MRTVAAAVESPLLLLGLLLALTLVLAALGRRRRLYLASAGGILVIGWLLGTNWVIDGLVRRWEAPYAAASPDAASGATWIVVLAAGARDEPRLPPAARLSAASLFRVAEGVRLQRAMPGATLLLMTGDAPNGVRGAAYADAAVAMGADARRLRALGGALNTEAEARAARRALPQRATLYLVTEALHLPRAERWFRRVGLLPIPAPAQAHAASAARPIGPGQFLPRAANYQKLERLIHEQLGMWAVARSD